MHIDDQKIYQKLDMGRVAESIEMLPRQIGQVLEETLFLKFAHEYNEIDKIIINGMGGSNLGAQMIKSVLAEKLKIPLLIESGYIVPAFVNKNTLYIISSYSGNTEEPFSVYNEVKKRGAKILIITMDDAKSRLRRLMIKKNIPGYVFNQKNNPSGQPRMGIGYTLFGLIMLLVKTRLYDIDINEIKKIIVEMEDRNKKMNPKIFINSNKIKQLANKTTDKILVLIGSEFLTGNLHIMRNQINESAKQLAIYLVLPDLNHYALEGLLFPRSNKDNLVFVFFNSNLYDKRIQRRAILTKRVVENNKIKAIDYKLTSKTKLSQACEMLQISSWLSYYLGILNHVDPVKIPWVDWFKKRLEK
jgi:glucose/mannose-6-phosphate isomerase